MRSFTLHLQDSTRYERVDDVVSFVGRDRTGSFGILAGRARMMTALEFGLARFRRSDGPWEYVALPGALVYAVRSEVFLSTRRYLRGPDPEGMAQALENQLRVEEFELLGLKESLRRMEEALFKHLWRMKRVAAAG